jgi:hypothetical protein
LKYNWPEEKHIKESVFVLYNRVRHLIDTMGSSRAAFCIGTVVLSLQAATVLLATTPPELVRLTAEPTTDIKACMAPGVGKAENR